MQHRLMVIGLNGQTAPAEVQRFWIPEVRRYEALIELGGADGIEEVVVLTNYNRTEFVLWSGDVSAASNSVLRFLTEHYGLRAAEWDKFYRKIGESALIHLCRMVAGLDDIRPGPDSAAALARAWGQAHAAGTSGRSLDTILAEVARIGDEVQNVNRPLADNILQSEIRTVAASLRNLCAQDSVLALRKWIERLIWLEFGNIRNDATLAADMDRAIDALAMRLAERISQTILKESTRAQQQPETDRTAAALRRLLRCEHVAVAGVKG